MNKPVRRQSLAISPRLSKILVNLSQVKKGQLLLDPFCGVGGILQEALIREINCYGIDKDKLAVEDAKRNLKWLESHYNLNATYKLQAIDARQTPNIRVDGIASEPALGEIVRKKPNDIKAKAIIDNFDSKLKRNKQLLELNKYVSVK